MLPSIYVNENFKYWIMDLKQLFLTRSHDGYLGKEDNVSFSKLNVICLLSLIINNFNYSLKYFINCNFITPN